MNEEITIASLTENQQIQIDYSDDDVIIIDSIKVLVEPDSARLRMNLIAICAEGRAQFDLNGQTLQLAKNQLLICPPNTTFTNFMFSHDFEFRTLFFTSRILQSFLHEKMHVWNELMYIHRMHILTLEEQDVSFIAHLYDLLRLCIDTRTDNPYRTEVIQSLLRSAFLGMAGTLRQKIPQQLLSSAPANSLFQRFLDLLNASTVKHRTVEFYASELCVTPKYLSTVCKKQSGKTANEWITEHVMEDIRYYLKSTDLSIKQVCNRLGFPNPSFFGKYVKEHFGITPTQLRTGN